jgi:UDP-glucose 4-epimerase
MYGASKLACEGMIEAFCEAFDFQAWIFRFVSVLGERYTHGCVFDFYKKLLQNPNELYILGNGKQNKAYIYVGDCIEAMFQAIHKSNDRINIFNIGREDQITVDKIVEILLAKLGLENVTKTYAGGSRGWVGDSPKILLDISRIKKLGIEPKVSINDAIIKTLQYLHENKHLLERE